MNLLRVLVALIGIAIFCQSPISASDRESRKMKRQHKKWQSEHKQMQEEHKGFLELLKWLQHHITHHDSTVDGHIKQIREHQSSLKRGMLTNMQKKRLKLEMGRKHNEFKEHHEHFLADHKKIRKIMLQIKELKSDLDSHKDCNHDHDDHSECDHD